MEAGIIKINITPYIGIPLAGYSDSIYSKGIHDDLYARILVLKDYDTRLALVGVDLLGVDSDFVGKVRHRMTALKCKTSPEQVIITCSHTHSGPRTNVYKRKNIKLIDQTYIDILVKKIAGAIACAEKKLCMVKFAVGNCKIEENLNRDIILSDGTYHYLPNEKHLLANADGITDDELGLIALVDAESRPLAQIVNYTAHPLCVGNTSELISADYPGFLASYLDKYIGGITLFTNGACGDIHPAGFETGFKRAEQMGKKLAQKAAGIYKTLKFHDYGKLRVINEKIQLPVIGERVDKGDYCKRFKDGLNTEMSVVSFDNVAFVGVPGELFVETGLSIKKKSPFEYTYIFYNTNEYASYIAPEIAHRQGVYKAVNDTAIAPAGAVAIEKTALKLLRKCFQKNER